MWRMSLHNFFFNDTATTEIYTLSLHDALPICRRSSRARCAESRTPSTPATTTSSSPPPTVARSRRCRTRGPDRKWRSEEHTSVLQSRLHLVCRLLLEKKKKNQHAPIDQT